jgi:hypothetical protein
MLVFDNNKLILYLQYPIRPAHLNYDKIEHLAARIKPEQEKVSRF